MLRPVLTVLNWRGGGWWNWHVDRLRERGREADTVQEGNLPPNGLGGCIEHSILKRGVNERARLTGRPRQVRLAKTNRARLEMVGLVSKAGW